MNNPKIGIIGVGNMGKAIYQALTKLISEKDLYLCDHHLDRLESLKATHITNQPEQTIDAADILIIAIKPQTFSELIRQLSPGKLENKIIVSIMAGISINKIEELSGSKKIVRAMPNLGAQLQESLTGWIATPTITTEEKSFIKQLFTSFGKEIELNQESQINQITALSGSGPAYIFYICELLQQEAQKFGFQQEAAKLIAEQTIKGASALLQQNLKSAEEWRKAVTSKGGTTEKALEYMQNNHLDQIFQQAIQQANTRAEELGN